jgi:hypothetical protein
MITFETQEDFENAVLQVIIDKLDIKVFARGYPFMTGVEVCPHTELIPREYYFSGSYNDTAYTEYWNECACCGKCSERTHESHSWFG